MLDRLRTPFFIVALVLVFLAVLVELSSLAFVGADSSMGDLKAPGLGIPYLAWLDGILFFTIGMMGLALIVPPNIFGMIHGIITFIVTLLTLIGAIVAIFVAIGLLTLMVSLFLAVPFGTIVYFAAYADFDVNPAAATLGFLMTMKIAFVIMLFLAQQRFLEVKGLVLLILTSFLAYIIVSFLHGIMPTFLVSILDAVAAIVVAILAAIWALIKLIGSIPAIVMGLRVDRH